MCNLEQKKVEEKWQKEKAAECVTNIVITFWHHLWSVTIQRQQHGIYLIYIIQKQKMVNRLTPMSDQDKISPYNINTISNR